ncbi:SRF-dependent transcription regulation-associated protein [Caenorhabditis elegans]|nr:SRF-dependent transcription regulation-associated protein [Caenorhabditis elegans]CTQ86431.1 SRF-dependent transcription regulation-associated protein [Caenorhabditis elegans]|eukprot:NP_001300492.1 Uncharacterized protein CELE_C03H5.3 [Caenorhabditis elegans]
METPKRAVKGQKTVEEKEKLPISLRKSERLAKNSGENSSAEIAEEHKEIVAPSQENSVDDDAESTQLSVDVFADPSDFEDDDDEVVPETDYEDNNEEPKNDQNPVEIPDNSDSDDDEPMEISSKNPVTSIENPENSDSDDDEPMEATSKAPEMSVAEPKSIIEKLLEKKAEKSAKLAAKKLKKRSKKKEAKKISDGVFQVKMKKSKAKFNVVTLKAGVQNILEPQINFREELLKSRTAGTRLADTEKFLQRGKWVSKR